MTFLHRAFQSTWSSLCYLGNFKNNSSYFCLYPLPWFQLSWPPLDLSENFLESCWVTALCCQVWRHPKRCAGMQIRCQSDILLDQGILPVLLLPNTNLDCIWIVIIKWMAFPPNGMDIYAKFFFYRQALKTLEVFRKRREIKVMFLPETRKQPHS